MQIVIKIINGDEHNVDVSVSIVWAYNYILLWLIYLKVSPEQTIISLKDLLASKLNIPANQQRLMYKGKSLAGKYMKRLNHLNSS